MPTFRSHTIILTTILSISSFFVFNGCTGSTPVSSTGITKAEAKLSVGSDGLTVDQRNVKQRLELESRPGSIKHFYVISAMSGQVILYSTVNGKVTSSGKRLTPSQVARVEGMGTSGGLFLLEIGGETHYTAEILQDDGTYGPSIEYLYWFDSQGRYHQHYITGGQIVHICDQPIAVRDIIINIEKDSDQ